MARPIKQGLDYFPLDISMDSKMELFEAEHGLLGFAFLIKLFQKIYDNGYYFEWTEDEQLLFSKRINVNINEVNVYINSAIKRKIFNQELFDKYKIITSRGIQKRFLEACKRRKQIEFIKEICLIDFNEVQYKDFKEKIVFVNNNLINVNINSINVNNNSTKEELLQHNVDNNSQSKVKEIESKVNKKEIETKRNNVSESCEDDLQEANDSCVDGLQEIINFYENNIGFLMPYGLEVFKTYLQKMPKEVIIFAMKISVEANVRTIKYIKGILNNWEKAGVKTLIEAKEENSKKEKHKKNKENNKNSNFNERNYNDLNSFYVNLRGNKNGDK